jgi:TRAP-type mannitol/chloroaromatic compound transport system permease small subunit
VRTLLLIALGLLLTWGLSEVLVSAATRGETTNDILRLPTWPAKVVLLASFVMFFVVAVWKELLTFTALRGEPTGGSR